MSDTPTRAGARQHIAARVWRRDGRQRIECRCGAWSSGLLPPAQARAAHRKHRAAMGEQVAPPRPSLRERLAAAEAERDRAVAAARQRIAAEIDAARLPRFAPGEDPETVARIMRNVDWRIAAWGPEAPYYQDVNSAEEASGG